MQKFGYAMLLMHPKYAERTANSVDPKKTTPLGVILNAVPDSLISSQETLKKLCTAINQSCYKVNYASLITISVL